MNANPVEVICRKRDGLALAPSEIEAFVAGAVAGRIPEYQVTAFLMAVFFQGMDLAETCALARAMIATGKTVHFSQSTPKIDKHSTGGVGDKVSIVLAPLAAALGVGVPMVSGRGLGHTGGTLDKLESIPGFRVRLTLEEFTALVERHGLAMMGQTDEFVPADRLLYSLRDVTGTVECIPLITASILSKKAAEGISGLVLDIKVGSGAFMKTQRDAEKLARTLVAVGKELGLRCRAVLTDMSQPLGENVGNALEILECIEVLRGGGPGDLREVTLELAAHMLILGDRMSSLSAGRAAARKALKDGSALAKFREMCQAQGAKGDVTSTPRLLRVSAHQADLVAERDGVITRMDGRGIGLVVIRLGGGRRKASDEIDHGVGIRFHAKTGRRVRKGEKLATVYYEPSRLKMDDTDIQEVLGLLAEAMPVSGSQSTPKAEASLIRKVIE